jgi:hypothetical protein
MNIQMNVYIAVKIVRLVIMIRFALLVIMDLL